jgi:hypothetical protein
MFKMNGSGIQKLIVGEGEEGYRYTSLRSSADTIPEMFIFVQSSRFPVMT